MSPASPRAWRVVRPSSAAGELVPGSEEVATAWATELERRSREIAEGHGQTVSWETARTAILKEPQSGMRFDRPADTGPRLRRRRVVVEWMRDDVSRMSGSSSLAPGGNVAWAFAIGWHQERHSPRFALGVYSLAHQKWQTSGEFDKLGDVAISPDATRVAAVADDHGRLTLQILDVASGRLTEGPYHRGMWPAASPTWSPEGTRLALQVRRPDESSYVAVLDLKTGELRSLSDGSRPRWSPDGEWIAFYSGRDCKLVRPDGTGLKTALHLKDSLMAARNFGWGGPVWSPDSRQLLLNVTKNGGPLLDVMLLDLATGRTSTQSKPGVPVYGWSRSSTSCRLRTPGQSP